MNARKPNQTKQKKQIWANIHQNNIPAQPIQKAYFNWKQNKSDHKSS